MSENKEKDSRIMAPSEAAEYLRVLAADLDAGRLKLGEAEIPVEGQAKLKASLKGKDDKTSLKVELKFVRPRPEAEDEEAGEAGEKKDSYKKLKKRMKESFKALTGCVDDGVCPSREAVETFTEMCREMTAYPDKGDEYYDAFNARAYDLIGAVDSGDVESVAEVVDSLRTMKDECHEKYK